MKRSFPKLLLGLALIILCTFTAFTWAKAQSTGGVTVTIRGTVNNITSTTIVVDGTTYPLSGNVVLPPGIQVGVKITLVGVVSDNSQTLIVTTVYLSDSTATVQPTSSGTPTSTATATATATASATSTLQATSDTTPSATSSTPSATATATPIIASNVIVVVVGPVRAKHDNVIVIYDFNIQLAPADPMLTVIQIGDWIHVKGAQQHDGSLIAIEVDSPIAKAQGGTALVEGRVQGINGDVITVNGVNVQLRPDDPRLKTLKIGVFVSVSGNFSPQGTTVVLVVVNIVIVNDGDLNIFLFCRRHDAMGMGMGMGDDGMGNPPPPPDGMGMGDDGMGMGMGMGFDECVW